MSLAICINCGAEKRRPQQRCPVCGFVPVAEEDKAKSVILSTYYEIEGEYRGKTKEELLAISNSVRERNYQFSPREIAGVIDYAGRIASIPSRVLFVDLVKWVGPALLLLAAAYLVIWLAK
jgi:hypothetical protein